MIGNALSDSFFAFAQPAYNAASEIWHIFTSLYWQFLALTGSIFGGVIVLAGILFAIYLLLWLDPILFGSTLDTIDTWTKEHYTAYKLDSMPTT